MASPFDEIDAAGQSAIEERLGEAIAIVGRSGGDYGKGNDPARPRINTTAITALSPRGAAVTDIQGRSLSGSMRVHGNSEIWLSRSVFENLAWRPKRDDVVLIDPDTAKEKIFVISALYPFGMGDVQIILSEQRSGK